MRISTQMKAIGLGGGLAVFIAIGIVATSGQYVPGGSFFCQNPGESPQWDGSAWQCRQVNDYRSKHIDLNDEYIANSCATGSPCGSAFSPTAAGTSSGFSSPYVSGRPGVIRLDTGTTSTGRAALNATANAYSFANYTLATFSQSWRVPTLSTPSERYAALIGYIDSTSSVDQTDGCYLLLDEGNVATSGPNTGNASKLSCWCSDNSARTPYLMDGSTVSDGSFTTVNAPVVAGTFMDTSIAVTIVSGTPTKAEFYVNGVKSCQITTNIPFAAGRETGIGIGIIKSVGTTARTLDIDRTRVALDLATGRSL